MKEDVGVGLSVLIDKTRYSKTFFDSEWWPNGQKRLSLIDKPLISFLQKNKTFTSKVIAEYQS